MSLVCLCAPQPFEEFSNPALIVGHPGHELKVFGWMAQYKPRLYALTDGSGREGVSRLPSTLRLSRALAIEADPLFGVISDRDLYQAILEKEIPWFVRTLEHIAGSLIQHNIDMVAADAIEGFNPTHDICRTLVDAAIMAVKYQTGRSIANYAFCLTEWEGHRVELHDQCCLHYGLDDLALCTKIESAEKYTELADEVHRAIALRGTEYFRVECLRKIAEPFEQRQCCGCPDYEHWGERRVAAGAYKNVIRYEEHVLPVMQGIGNHVSRSKPLELAMARRQGG